MSIPRFVLTRADGLEVGRDNWVVCFFFPNPFPPVAEAARAAFEAWQATVDPRVVKWGLVGSSAEESKPAGPKTLSQCAAMLDRARASKRAMTAFSLFGPQEDAPDHLFGVAGDRDVEGGYLANVVGFLEVRF